MSAHEIVAASLAALALLLTALSLQVSRLRLRHRVSFGDGGHKDLLVATRAHGNALEQCLLYAVLALAAAALPGVGPASLAACAAAFVAARVLHVAGLFGRRLLLRQLAHATSTLVHLALAGLIALALWVRP
jgi:uncharacterized membrane protein YecN with MAPEG domain